MKKIDENTFANPDYRGYGTSISFIQ